jgi:hypothetical protein
MRDTFGLALLLLPAAFGCSPGPALATGPTDEVYAAVIVGAGGSGKAEVRAEPRVGPAQDAPLLQLGDGDVLAITDGTLHEDLSFHAEPTGETWYQAGLLTDVENTQYVISLARASDAGAPHSAVTMPAALALGSPTPGAALSRALDDIKVTWSPSGHAEAIQWRAWGDCLGDNGGPVQGDPGTFVIRAGTLVPAKGHATETCDVRVEIMRDRSGQLDARFAGGFIVARQVRGIYISSKP